MQHKPIEFKVPAASAADVSVQDRLAPEDRTESRQHRHADAQPSRTALVEPDAKHAQREPRVQTDRDRSKERVPSKAEASDAKHAQHEHRESRATRAEPKHAQRDSKYDLDRAKRNADRAREHRSREPHRHREADRDEPSRHRDADQERRRSSPARRHSMPRYKQPSTWFQLRHH